MYLQRENVLYVMEYAPLWNSWYFTA